MAYPDNIILYYCGSQKNEKNLNPFILDSITVHLVMLFDVFLVYETKFAVGKWQVVVFTAGKRRGRWGGFDTWGNPPSSAGLRPHNAIGFRQKKCFKHFIGQSAVCLTVSFHPADNTAVAKDTNT